MIALIRDLKWEDFDDLISNYYSYYDEVGAENPQIGLVFHDKKPDLEAEVMWFSGLYHDVLSGDAVALVAEENGHAVGLCDVHSKRPGSEVSHVGVLGISILKKYRGQGIGKSLMTEVLKRCKGKFDMIILGVFEINTRAISLYRSLGFKEYGSLPYSVKRGDHFYTELQMYYRL